MNICPSCDEEYKGNRCDCGYIDQAKPKESIISCKCGKPARVESAGRWWCQPCFDKDRQCAEPGCEMHGYEKAKDGWRCYAHAP